MKNPIAQLLTIYIRFFKLKKITFQKNRINYQTIVVSMPHPLEMIFSVGSTEPGSVS